MALEYTEEKLNSLDKETIIQLFLVQQEQLRQIDHHLQLVLEQLSDLKRHRFGRSSERHGTDGQISFMEVDGQIVFFNEAEAVSAEDPDDCREDAPDTPRRRSKKEPEPSVDFPNTYVFQMLNGIILYTGLMTEYPIGPLA